MKKRGQEGGAGSAALVALITLFIIISIVLLPSSERAKILDDTISPLEKNAGNKSADRGEYLLLENPGTVLPPFASNFVYPIAPIEISSKTSANEIEFVKNMLVKSSFFSAQQQDVDFQLENPELAENVLLNFLTKEASGSLIINLNGQNVFNREIASARIDPVKLPINSLQQDNKLTFSTEKVGAAFWRFNKYVLEDVSITADITDLTNTVGSSAFYVAEDDIGRLRSARLFFLPTCSAGSGKLTITLNGVDVYNSKPVCGSIGAVDFSPTVLLEGNNRVRFKTDNGAYSISRIQVSSDPIEDEEYIYYFKIGPKLYDDAFFGNVRIMATLKFASSGNEKEGKLVVNGFVRSFEVKEAGYALDITDFIEEGFNSIQLIPEEPLNVVELRVDVE